MTVRKLKYILFTLAPLSAMLMTGCLDEPLADTDRFDNPDLISFTATTGSGVASTRAGEEKQLYEPLVLTDDAASQTLYLHTYDSERIGFEPGDDVTSDESDGAQTRGNQIKTADDLIKFHKDFMVHAQFKEDGVEYIEWSKTQVSSANNFWRTEKTRYWPGERELSFMAVSPTAEFNSLNNKVFSDQQATFTYTAKKQGNNRDAEAQTDLLLAAGTCNKPNSVNGRAPLKFHHALSAIKFAVRDVLDGEVVNVQIAGVHSSGNCVYTAHSDGEGSFTWTGQTGSETYSQNFNYAINGRPAAGIDPGDDSQDILLNDAMPEKTFMLIPQRIPDNAEIIVTLKRTNPGKDEDGKQLPETITVRGKIKANDVQEWLPGHEYVYTISTSKDNWVYVFNVNGNYRNHSEIYMPCPADADIFKTYTEGGGTNRPYYEVVSYRYHANNFNVTEKLPWKASHGDGVQYYYTYLYQSFAEKDQVLYLDRPRHHSVRTDIPAAQWLTDLFATPLQGSGSTAPERHNLSFMPTIVTTDWHGDEKMYQNNPYANNSESNPWDLSTFGGQTSRNTANCYVIDREGWYAIPLYYGNAVKNGAANSGAWETNETTCPDRSATQSNVTFNYYGLWKFKDHKGNEISTQTGNTGRIPDSYYKSAHLLWQDTYNVIENVKLATVNGEKMIVFHVNKDNIQQGNAIIGLSENTENNFNKTNPQIVWSWHIWFNEHWLNNSGVSNAFATSGFDTSINSVSQMQNQGDLDVTVPKSGSITQTFRVSPYNIGWCDAKNVRYLSRYNTMDFVQYQKDGIKKTGKTAQLPIIQDGRTIQYRIGNNVYFQFGRKDPFVGFIDDKSDLKPNFGKLEYTLKPQLRSIAYAIQHPHELFVGAEATENGGTATANNEWNGEDNWGNSSKKLTEFYNLWNNTSYNKNSRNNAETMTDNEFFTSRKTVYDPSPAGYVVPPAGFFKILFRQEPSTMTYITTDKYGNEITKSYVYNMNASVVKPNSLTTVLNGVTHTNASGHPIYRIYTKRGNSSKFFSLTGTGHRWYANSLVGAGNNFNPQIAYLWTSNVTKVLADRSAYTIAVGLDGANYIVSTAFCGRKAMARPIRCIREY